MSYRKKLGQQFGEIDIYLFDQILKGRFDDREKLLDAGCGGGRNLPWFWQNGFDVFGIDTAEAAIEQTRLRAAALAPHLPAGNLRVASVEQLPFQDAQFDAVISSAVLHFARDTAHFGAMLEEMWRVLKKDGLFFARMASSIGIEDRLTPLTEGRYTLPDGSDRYVVTEAQLLRWTKKLNATLLDPVKTTNVQNLRCMTTWCLEK